MNRNRKPLLTIYSEKYGTTWGLNDIQRCEFDYKECITNDLIRLLLSLTKNPEFIFGGTHHTNKLNQIVYAIRNELALRRNETHEFIDSDYKKRIPQERNFNTIDYQEKQHEKRSYRTNGYRYEQPTT